MTNYFNAKTVKQDEEICVNCPNGVVSKNDWTGNSELVEIELNGIIQICAFAFSECTSLTTIDFDSSLCRIDNNAFMGCTALQNISIPGNLEEVDCWLDCKRTKKITLFKPSSLEFINYLKKGYPMDLCYKGERRDDYWN